MTRIEVQQGDITTIEVDALVNAANNRLWMGGGVAGALKRVGGREIEEAAIVRGPVAVGEAVATGAGRLKATYVIHAAVMGQDLRTDADKIGEATGNTLQCAEGFGVRSIAFPALGTGVGGFPVGECARIMIDEVIKHATGESVLELVLFVLFEEATYRTFLKELAGQTGEKQGR